MKTLAQTIKEFGDTQEGVAKYLGITQSTLSWKINGKAEFKQSEIKSLAERYLLSPEEIAEIFFEKENETV